MVEEGKKFKFFRKSGFGLSTWTIWYEGSVIFYSSALAEGGVPQVHTEKVELNQSGRTLEQQIELQMRSRCSRMADKGYKTTREEALEGATNQMGLVNPMLAHPIDKVPFNFSELIPAHIQIKYDGHRCLVTRHEGRLIAYTRKGKLISTIDHILKILDPAIQEGMTIDGELYIHGLPLQTVSSAIKRMQESSRALAYHIYDVVDTLTFHERWAILKSAIDPIQTSSVGCVDTQRVTSWEEIYKHFRWARANGYEGSMLRLSTRGYEDGKRSSQLLKVKERADEDFEVEDVFPGKNEIGILRLKLNDRQATFDCTAPGGVVEKQQILANKHLYIGRRVTVEYAHKTNDGVPFHGVATRFVEEV